MEALNRRSDLRAHLAGTPGSGSLLEVDAWIPSEVKAISPLVECCRRNASSRKSTTRALASNAKDEG